jgi:hypothetical protein
MLLFLKFVLSRKFSSRIFLCPENVSFPEMFLSRKYFFPGSRVRGAPPGYLQAFRIE